MTGLVAGLFLSTRNANDVAINRTGITSCHVLFAAFHWVVNCIEEVLLYFSFHNMVRPHDDMYWIFLSQADRTDDLQGPIARPSMQPMSQPQKCNGTKNCSRGIKRC